MKIKSYRTNQNIKTIKNCILVLLFISLTSCPFKAIRVTECYGIRGLEEIPSGFWCDYKSVSVTIWMEKNIDAEKAGGRRKSTNLFPYGMLAYGLAPVGGVLLNPVLSMGVPLAIDATTDGKSLDSTEFHKDINNTISNSSCTKEKIFLDLIKQKLTFLTMVQPSYKMETLEETNLPFFERNAEMESDAYVSISLRLFMSPDFKHKDPDPRAKMVAITSLVVATKDSMQRQADFSKKFSSPKDKILRMSCSEVQREKLFQGTYNGYVIKETESFAHSKWLSDNGIFLEETIKELLQKSLFELNQKIRTGTSS
jgi:hypothetical protein